MKNGNASKKFGIISLIGAMISGLINRPKNVTVQELEKKKSMLLTNYGKAPIPEKMLNQRQKRKRYRQSHTCK